MTRNFAQYWCCFIYILQELWLLVCILEVGQPHWISPKMNNIMGLFTLLAVSLVRYSPSHRVDRVLGFFSSRPNWDSTTPSLWPGCCVPPHLVPRGGATLTCGRGGGVPIRTGRETLWYSTIYNLHVLYCTWLEFTDAIRGAGARSAPFFVFKSLKK